MPLLEPGRRIFTTNSLIGSFLSPFDRIYETLLIVFDFPLGRYWAIFWAMAHLGGFLLGSSLAIGTNWGEVLVLSRISCIMPIFLGIIPRKWTPIIWALIVLFSIAAGSQDSFDRQNRISVSAVNDWEPSTKISFSGTCLFRPTAWAKSGRDSFWQSPAILLAWKPANPETQLISGPIVGDGLMISGKGKPPLPGEILGASIQALVPGESTLPGIFDYRRYLRGRGIRWRAQSTNSHVLPKCKEVLPGLLGILGKIRQRILAAIEEAIPPPESNLMMAVLLGERTTIAREAAQPFSRLGLSHLFAVSGLHVGIIMGIILLPLGLFHLNPGWRLVPAILFLPFYILLTGGPGSVFRAAGMTLLLLLAFPLGRKSHSLQLLGLLFWAGIIWQPAQVLDSGMRLSYLATGGIIAVVNLIGNAKTTFWRSKRGRVGTGLIVSLAAQWFTFPQVASSFGYVSGFSPLANLFTVPLFGLAVWTLVIGLGFDLFLPGIGQNLLAWTWLIVRFLTGLLSQINPKVQSWNLAFPVPNLVDGMVWAIATVVMLAIIRIWNMGKAEGKKVILILSVLCGSVLTLFQWGSLGMNSSENIHVLQFAVDQGDCCLIIFPDGWCGFIDTAGVTGWSGSNQKTIIERKVLPWLQRQHIKSIDAIVLSHGHLDHTGGTNKLLKDYKVGTIFTGGSSRQSVIQSNPPNHSITPGPGEILHRWDDWELYFIQPDTLLTSNLHENNKSLVVVLRKGKSIQMVWAGDMEKQEEKLLLNTNLMPHKVVVLKAGHHGSNTSSSQPFLDALDPELVLISCGVNNQYHHPSHGPYQVKGDTLPVLRTDLCGSIHLTWDRAGNLTYNAGNRKGFRAEP